MVLFLVSMLFLIMLMFFLRLLEPFVIALKFSSADTIIETLVVLFALAYFSYLLVAFYYFFLIVIFDRLLDI